MPGQSRIGEHSSLAAEIEVSVAHECLMTLYVLSDEARRASYEAGPVWFDSVGQQASPDLLATIEQFNFRTNQVWEHLLSLVYDCPEPRDVPTFLDFLEQTDALEIRLHLLGYYVREHRRVTPPDIIFQAAQGDAGAQKQLLKTSFPNDAGWQRTLRWLLALDIEATKRLLVDILRRWYDEVFQKQEPQILPILTRDAEAKRALQASMPAEQLIEVATGWEYLPEPGIRRVVLIPSYILRPWSTSGERAGTRIFCYPVADESITADSETPPARLVRLVKALADERRLRVLKRLATGSYTLQEIADEFGVPKTTMQHHLTALRQAGLVRMRMSDYRYSLRSEVLESVGGLLSEYIKKGEHP
ncbi:MAG TPA: metalloregulator ArsR/SmtB family transcription factor [Ktedonobacteraceae bacterium]|nr:metalloregulator ArsR/SmtB family transcription factor [Ktedonobacteraceae bacterium]